MNCFKHILVRIAGSSMDSFNYGPELKHLDDCVRLYIRLKKIYFYKIDKLCNHLYCIIPNKEPKHQRVLLNFKRDVYNSRFYNADKISKLPLDEKTIHKYRIILNVNAGIEEIKKEIERLYGKLYNKEIQMMKTFFDDEMFMKGLLLSSDQLFSYALKNRSTDEFDKKHTIGIWKYITRLAAKTSPFSTFTHLAIGHIECCPEIISFGNQTEVKSFVRLNNFILDQVISYFRAHPVLRKHLKVQSNSTIRESVISYEFMTNSNNVESFQTIEKNDTIDIVLEKVKADKQLLYDDLIQQLMTKLDATEFEIDDYLYKLIQTGLIEFDIGISGLDTNWVLLVKKKFEEDYGSFEGSSDIISRLNNITILTEEYCTSDAVTREAILRSIGDHVDSLLQHLYISVSDYFAQKGNFHVAQQRYINKADQNSFDEKKIFLHSNNLQTKFYKKNIVYEDCSNLVRVSIDKEKIEAFIENLNSIIKTFAFVSSFDFEIYKMNNFFQLNFKGADVNVLDFYKKYYKHKSSKDQSNDDGGNQDEDNEEVQQYFSNINFLSRIVYQPDNEAFFTFRNRECIIDSKLLETIIPKVPAVNNVNESYGAFIQFYIDQNREGEQVLKGVVNGIFPGNGKLLSRFLHLFDPEVTETLTKWNAFDEGNEIIAENTDASFFNANLHPSLTEYELRMPGAHNRLCIDKQIDVSNIFIRNVNGKLGLYSDSKNVKVLDLGFQGIGGRSNLFKLLSSFGDNHHFSYEAINKIINSSVVKKKILPNSNVHYFVYPRISFDETIILQRAKWLLPTVAIDFLKNNNDTHHAYFSLQTLRIELKIPDEIFFYVLHKESKENQKRDKEKPQYINFYSPMCVQILAKSLVDDIEFIEIEEMLPTSRNMANIKNEKFTTEFLVQWKTN